MSRKDYDYDLDLRAHLYAPETRKQYLCRSEAVGFSYFSNLVLICCIVAGAVREVTGKEHQ